MLAAGGVPASAASRSVVGCGAATASTALINPISIFELPQMNYGPIAVASSGGRVTRAPNGVTAPGGLLSPA